MRVILVHGWGGSPQRDWFPWLKKELTRKGFNVLVPHMPKTGEPEMHAWVGTLMRTVGVPRKDDIFVGHSIGCQTILRYFETLSKKERVGKVILVAPWMKLKHMEKEERPIAKPWIETPIDWKHVRAQAQSFTCLFSDNDLYVPLSEKKTFEKKLHAETMVFKKHGHFSAGEGFKRLPVLKKFF